MGIIATLLYMSYRRKQNDNKIINYEKKKSDDLLLNILPNETAEELKITGKATARKYELVTVLFTDFVDFTQISEELTAEEIVEQINFCFSGFDNILDKYNIEKIKTVGDSYMCAGGLPVINTSNPRDVMNAAIEIRHFMENYNGERAKAGKCLFRIRIGIHSGSVVAGVVGVKKFAYDIWGDTVNIASRMESASEPDRINISGSTYELLKGKFSFEYRGRIQAKHKGEIDMYFLN
jgi:class 3 adenylate cyclase